MSIKQNNSDIISQIEMDLQQNTKQGDDLDRYQKLIQIIQNSSKQKQYHKTTAAMAILQSSYKQIRGEDFSEIQLQDCDLSGMNFIECNFNRSKMNNITIIGCWFIKCNLNDVIWENVVSYEQKVINIESQQISTTFAISPNESTITHKEHNKNIIKVQNLNNNNLKVIQIAGIYKFAYLTEIQLILSDSKHYEIRNVFTGGRLYCFNYPLFENDQILPQQALITGQIRQKNLGIVRYQNGKILRSCKNFNGFRNISSKLITNESKQFRAAFIANENVVIWDFQKGKSLNAFSQPDGFEVTTLLFSPTGKYLAVLCKNQKTTFLLIKNINELEKLSNIEQEFNFFIEQILYSRDGDYIACQQVETQQVYLFNLKNGEKRTFQIPQNHNLNSIVQSISQLYMICQRSGKVILGAIPPLSISKQQNGKLSDLVKKNKIKIFPSSCNAKVFIFSDNKKNVFEININTLEMKEKKNINGVILISANSPSLRVLAFTTEKDQKKIYLYDSIQETILKNYSAPSTVTSLAISSNETYLAFGCQDLTIRIININTQKVEQLFKSEKQVIHISFSPNNQYLISGTSQENNTNLVLWDIQLTQKMYKFEVLLNIEKTNILAKFSPDSKFLAFCQTSLIRLHNIINGKSIYIKKNFCWNILELIFLNEEYILLASQHSFQIFDVNEQTKIKQININFSIRQVTYFPESQTLTCVSQEGQLEKYNLFFEAKVQKNIDKYEGSVRQLVSCPKEKILISLLDDSSMKVWNFKQKYQFQNFIKYPQQIINFITLSRSGKLFAYCTNDNVINIQILKYFENYCKYQEMSQVNSIDFSVDEQYLIYGISDNTIKLFDISKKFLSRVVAIILGTIKQILICSDNLNLISSSSHNQITMWDLQSINRSNWYYQHSVEIFTVTISLNDRFIAFGSADCKVYVLDKTNGMIIQQFNSNNNQRVKAIAFSSYLIFVSGYELSSQFTIIYGESKIRIINIKETVSTLTILDHNQSFAFGNTNGTYIGQISINVGPIQSCDQGDYLNVENSSFHGAQIISTFGFDLTKVLQAIQKN